MKISFVCTGNTCRSPIAEYVFKKMLLDANITNIQVESCGIAVINEQTISPLSKMVIEENIKDIEVNHTPKLFTEEIFFDCDLFVTMTLLHKQVLQFTYIDNQNKIYSIGELSGVGDIDDPFGCQIKNYQRVYETIKKSLEIAYDKILDLLKTKENS